MFHLVDVQTTLRAIKSLRVAAGGNSSVLRLPFNVTVVVNSPLRELSEDATPATAKALRELGDTLRVHTPDVPLSFSRRRTWCRSWHSRRGWMRSGRCTAMRR